MTQMPADPRLTGIKEHFKRVEFFMELGRKQTEKKNHFRLMLACVHSGISILNLVQEALEKSNIEGFAREWFLNCQTDVMRFNLIYSIRLHDFHRFGLAFEDSNDCFTRMIFSPGKLIANKGAAAIVETEKMPIIIKTGNSSVKLDRPLRKKGNTFLDENTHEYLELEKIIEDFFKSLKPKVELAIERLNSPMK